MRKAVLVLIVALSLLAFTGSAEAAPEDPGDDPPYQCVGPWYKEYKVGPFTVLVCDPFMGQPPW